MNKFTFSELKEAVQNAPLTWLPALFVYCVNACVKNHVFQKGAMARICREEEAKDEGRKS